jgi:hypothetical protein
MRIEQSVSAEQTVPADEVGFSTLMNISDADKLNNWMFESIHPYVKGNVLEIGSGIGNISSMFVNRRMTLSLSDYSDEYCDFLRKKFNSVPYIKDVFKIDLVDKYFESTHAHILGTFDTGGHLILLMPAYQVLYNRFDKELGHFRRHTRSTMNKLLSNDFEVIKTWHFNLAGIFGWWLFGSVLRRKIISKGQMNTYEKLIPLFRFADWITLRRIGLSVIGVGRKK